MSIQPEIDRISEAKAALKEVIKSKGVSVPANAPIDDLPGYAEQIVQNIDNADRVDGWHLAVINKGEVIPVTQTICFVRGG